LAKKKVRFWWLVISFKRYFKLILMGLAIDNRMLGMKMIIMYQIRV
jgi:hypothetical protein